VIVRPTNEWEVGAEEPDVCLPSFWPSQIARVNSLETAGGLLQKLVVVPAQFRCDSGSGNDVLGLERLYTALGGDLLRCPEGETVVPAIRRVELTNDDGTVHVLVDAVDESGIDRIVALVFHEGGITPTIVDVDVEAAGPYEFDIANVTADDRIIIQVQDGFCNVATASGKGTKLATMEIESLGDGQFVPGEPEAFPVKIFGIGGLSQPLYYEWDFGDGSPLESGTLMPLDLTPDGSGNATFTVNHTYDLGDTGVARVRVLDAGGAIALDLIAFGCDESSDGDADALSICTELVAGTDPVVNDTDGDGCADGEELLNPTHASGGERDPLDFWDFFDADGNKFIDLSDAVFILTYFGDKGTEGVGQLLDRQLVEGRPVWRPVEANDGVDLRDALANLRSFGDSCMALP
jgi:hypothetical protein